MEIKPEQVIEYLGFAEVKTFDEFKEKFESPEGFAKRSFIESEIGKTLGGATTKLKKVAEELGVELTPEDLEEMVTDRNGNQVKKNKQYVDIFKTSVQKLQGKIAELEGKTLQNNDEQIKALTEELTQIRSSLVDERKAKKTVQALYDKEKETFSTQLKEYKKTTEFDKAWGEVSKDFAQNDELKIKGFRAVLSEQRDYDFDEEGKYYVKDKITGQKIPSGKKAGEFKSPVEDLRELAEKSGLIKKNPEAGNPVKPLTFGQPNGQNQPPQNGAPKRQLSPAALKAAGMI